MDIYDILYIVVGIVFGIFVAREAMKDYPAPIDFSSMVLATLVGALVGITWIASLPVFFIGWLISKTIKGK